MNYNIEHKEFYFQAAAFSALQVAAEAFDKISRLRQMLPTEAVTNNLQSTSEALAKAKNQLATVKQRVKINVCYLCVVCYIV